MAHDIVDATGRSLIDSMLDTEILGLSLLSGQSDEAQADEPEPSEAPAEQAEAAASDEARWSALTAQLASGVATQGSDAVETFDAMTISNGSELLATLSSSASASAPRAAISAMLAPADDLFVPRPYDVTPPAPSSDAPASTSTDTFGSNGSAVTSVAVAASGNQGIDGLLIGTRWAGGSITYSDPTAANQYQAGHPQAFSNFQHIDAQQIVAMHFALNDFQYTQPAGAAGFSVEGFTGLDISYNGANGTGTLRLANTSNNSTAVGYYPSNGIAGGDSFYGGSGRTPTMGDYDWHTMLHEIGHTLGLKHGQETSVYGAMPSNLDAMEYTVMTYRSYAGGPLTGYTNEQFGYAQTYMMYDIAALQYMYGADFTTNSGNTTYSWNPGNGNTVVNGLTTISPGGNRIFMTIWDGGGTDTYDLSAYTNGVNVDLSPGGYSVLSQTQRADLDQFSADTTRIAKGNVYNALQYQGNAASLIENATGGSGADTLSGNIANNVLTGNAGNDALWGGDGNDNIYGGSDADTLKGGAGSNYLDGGTGADSIKGGAGSDTIIDRDAINGDSIDGGDGLDWAYFDGSSFINNVITYDLGAGTVSVTAGNTQSMVGIENLFTDDAAETLIGSSVANQLWSNGGDDVVYGGGNDDTIKGGGGNDTMYGGSGFDSVIGSDGDDYMRYISGEGYDRFYGGAGTDTVVLDTFDTDNYVVILGASGTYTGGIFGPHALQDIENVTTGNNNDTVTGDGLANLISVSGGSDLVDAGGGADTIYGGDANDTIYGGSGVDSVFGGAGDDFMRYIDGDAYDHFYGGLGIDTGVLDTFSTENYTVVLGATGTYSNGNATFAFEDIENVTTGDNNDTVTGDSSANSISVSGGNDLVNGGGGNDTLKGGGGNDTLNGGSGVDSVKGGAGDDLLTYTSGEGYDNFYGDDGIDTGVLETFGSEDYTVVLGAAGTYSNGSATFDFENIENVTTGDNNDTITGDALANSINVGNGNNYASGGAGTDQIYGGSGNDTMYGGTEGDTLKGGGGFNYLDGGDGADSIKGGAGDDTIIDRDFINGDSIDGGDGNDWAYFNATGFVDNVITYNLAAGTVSVTLGNTQTMVGIENLYTDEASETLIGSNVANVLYANGGNDSITSGFGDDDIFGGTGNDKAFGDDGADSLSGGSGIDTLKGGAGSDTLAGGADNDQYYVDATTDIIIEGAGEGTSDTVFSVGTFALASDDDIERLVTTNFLGVAALNLTGNGLAQLISGNAGANKLLGLGGADSLSSSAGSDTLDGGTGNDTMSGGLDNDLYTVDSALDVIIENAGGGTADRVQASVSFALAGSNDIEFLTTTNFAGFAAINLTGSNLAQLISGNNGVNTLLGLGGDDSMTSFAGADVLDGGAGNDTMVGGTDNDIYYVNGQGDVVTEVAAGGTNDRVVASATYALSATANIEFLGTTNAAGVGAINLTGSSISQQIDGNDGANRILGLGGDDEIRGFAGNDTLDGGTGSDTLDGYLGNDTYFVNVQTDVIFDFGGEGTADRVLASASYTLDISNDIEFLATNNSAAFAAINLTGNGVSQRVSGNAGANVLDGLGGNDTLEGFGGADTFVFSSALGAGNLDVISGFSVADDTIQLSAAIFTGLTSGFALTAAEFVANAAGQASDVFQRIIYETDTGNLWFDVDGTGVAARVQFADLASALGVTAADFFVSV